MIVLGFDPGSANFGFSVIKMKGRALTVLEIGQIESTVSNLTDKTAYKKITKLQRAKAKAKGKRLLVKDQPSTPPFTVGLGKFDRVIGKLLREYSPEVVIAERFQTRGIKGVTIEAVSIMLGVIALHCHRRKIKVNLTTAATWKNQVNKTITLDDFYITAKEHGFTPHECDAYMMGVYAASKELGDLDKWVKKTEAAMKAYVKASSVNNSE